MKVILHVTKPLPPPIEKVVIELTLEEATQLCRNYPNAADSFSSSPSSTMATKIREALERQEHPNLGSKLGSGW